MSGHGLLNSAVRTMTSILSRSRPSVHAASALASADSVASIQAVFKDDLKQTQNGRLSITKKTLTP
jgi:hypothetical protein